MDELKATRVYQSLARPQLFLGMEKAPAVALVTLCAFVFISFLNWMGAMVAAGVFYLSHNVLRGVADSDPQAVEIYRRSIRYKASYSAQAHPCRTEVLVRRKWNP